MKRVSRSLAIVCVVLGCVIFIVFPKIHPALTMPHIVLESSVPLNVAQAIDLEKHFEELGVEGSISIYDAQSDRTYQHNPQRNATAFLPASTFKILNSLISLETGVINDEIAILTWDGISRQVSTRDVKVAHLGSMPRRKPTNNSHFQRF